jgi:hypothetical protein
VLTCSPASTLPCSKNLRNGANTPTESIQEIKTPSQRHSPNCANPSAKTERTPWLLQN